MGALAAALGTMVANLSAHKPGWDDRWEEFSNYADQGQVHLKELLALVDEDTDAFNRIMDAFKLPKATPEEKEARTAAIQAATLYATEVPLRTMKAAAAVMPLVRAMAEQGNPNSVSDAGVGALAARSAVLGAYINVQINAAGLKDRTKADAILAEAKAIAEKAEKDEAEIMATVSRVINGDK
jgi:glutamate formiminotransferase/formiminotetrahydrofolate cyclodeaminase